MRTVQVTGSNHVASDIHELQPAVIDNTHFAALVAAAEREACAKVCDVLAVHPEYASNVTKLAALAIRKRGAP